jgi:ribosomal protein S27E
MGLLSNETEIGIISTNSDWYESRGYVVPRYKNNRGKVIIPKGTKIKVKVTDLKNGSNAIVNVKCDNCEKEYPMIWRNYQNFSKEDGKIYCNKCAMALYGTKNRMLSRLKNSISFEQWCLDNNRQDILNRWDYDLNDVEPSNIGYGANTKYWFKCPLGIHSSELKEINTISSRKYFDAQCNQCNSIGQWLINSYGSNALEIYWSDKNLVSPFEVSYGSCNNFVYLNCPDCGNIKLISPNRFTRQGLGCPKCSDGISYPNKIAFNILEQLHVDFINEYSPNWIKPKRYDFYFELKNKKYILEMDGAFHDDKCVKSNDYYKDNLATENGIEVIRIDCNYNGFNRLSYIKDNILNSKLSKIFDLSEIDWLLCHQYSCTSLVKIVCDYWNNGDNTVLNIANKFKLSSATIRHYLIYGTKLKWCSYIGQEEKFKNIENQRIKVYCVELDRIFNSIIEIKSELNICIRHISDCCRNKPKYKTAGGYHWIYYEDYMKLNNKELS